MRHRNVEKNKANPYKNLSKYNFVKLNMLHLELVIEYIGKGLFIIFNICFWIYNVTFVCYI